VRQQKKEWIYLKLSISKFGIS